MPASRLRAALLNHPLAPVADPRPDGELLTLFVQRGDESAFAALVVRHTPAVHAACRTWLRSPADVDDAAQATFLVLVRRADSIRDPKALPRWLYRVAGNVARRLRKQLAKAGPLPADVPDRAIPVVDDLADVVAEEVARLPEKYRLPVQLCYAAGLSAAAAAERLGCPRGTVLTRLARGRDLIVRRLAARGAAPAALLATLSEVRAVAPGWVAATTRAAKGLLAGASPAVFGVSDRTVTLTEGAVRAMTWKNLRAIAAVAMLATGLIGFVVGQWASADPSGPPRKPAADGTPDRTEAAEPARDAKADDAKPAPGRRREAVIRLPIGTFVKEFDAPPYGSGRLIWEYQEDRVLGRVEASVMGVEVELATEAEISLSANGTIYGILNSVKLTHVRIPEGGELAELKPYVGLWPVVEPLVAELTTDLPFSYQFRVSGDRLSIHNFRMLLAGPNPLGKVAAVAGDLREAAGLLMYFQAVGVAVEGSYAAADAKEKETPRARPTFKKPPARTAAPLTLPSSSYLSPTAPEGQADAPLPHQPKDR
ncbi:MAG TPA: sigma-70 family RNA polymerase sigma factor [Fimbriiglobus sp.]|nr:sigma-70 family RNA polymerase sigma factor [Fimbriiglobus sp.]